MGDKGRRETVAMTASSGRLSGSWSKIRGGRVPREEPNYVRTAPYDGGKYIDADKFLEDEDIQHQLDWFEKLNPIDGPQRGQLEP